MGRTEAERRRRENRGAKGVRRDVLLPDRLGGLKERRELPAGSRAEPRLPTHILAYLRPTEHF